MALATRESHECPLCLVSGMNPSLLGPRMLSVYRTLSLRYLRLRWVRASLIVLSIAAGVGMLVATHALNHGVELRDVQHMLGHVSISTTQVYRRLAGETMPAETIIEISSAAELA